MKASAWVIGLLLFMACTSSPSAPATETAQNPAGGPAAAPARPASAAPPVIAAPTATPTDDSESGLVGGSAKVTLAGQTYQLHTGEAPICMLTIGVQVGMARDDRTVSLTVHALGELNPTNFALITPDDRWVPADGSPTFEVSGGQATWSGTLVGQHTDREEDGVIEIDCGG